MPTFKVVTIPLGTFSPELDEELEARLEIGLVDFDYITTTTTDTHSKGSLRHALGTRNLSMSFIPFESVPWGGKTPPPHVLTYYDAFRGEWRCCSRNHITRISEDILVEI